MEQTHFRLMYDFSQNIAERERITDNLENQDKWLFISLLQLPKGTFRMLRLVIRALSHHHCCFQKY